MRLAVSGFVLMFLAACSEVHPIDAPDVNLPEPSAIELEAWRGDAFRKDPLWLADYELKLHLEICEWRHIPFNPQRYTFYERNLEKPEWGSYVTRGHVDKAGRTWRYRVKVARVGDIWYAKQISHYLLVELAHPALEEE